MKHLIDQAADRAIYICQSQSLNLWLETPTFSKLSSMHFYAWKSGLKTGMYYLRTKSAVDAIKFTLDNTKAEKEVEKNLAESSVSVNEKTTTASIAASSQSETKADVVVEPLDPDELKQMLEQSKKNEDDDCLMCGS